MHNVPKWSETLLKSWSICKSSRLVVLCKKAFLKSSQNSQENNYASVSFCRPACNFIKKETLAPVFSCELCEIFKNSFYYRTPSVAGSCICNKISEVCLTILRRQTLNVLNVTISISGKLQENFRKMLQLNFQDVRTLHNFTQRY